MFTELTDLKIKLDWTCFDRKTLEVGPLSRDPEFSGVFTALYAFEKMKKRGLKNIRISSKGLKKSSRLRPLLKELKKSCSHWEELKD